MKRRAVEVLKEGDGEGDGRGAHKKRRVDVNFQETGFDIKELSLVATTVDGKSYISTLGFLSVSKLLLHVLDKVVPTMAILRQDVRQNIERLEGIYILDSSLYSDLVEVLKREVDAGTAKKQQSCSRAIVWLTRAMHFSMVLSEKLKKDSETNFEQAVEEAYTEILKPWHGWIASAAYKVALRLLPDRKTFMDLLLDGRKPFDVSEENVCSIFFQFQPFLSDINNYLVTFNLETMMSN